ncbi:hybrid sensor histidine kinase/response regulator [Desulfobacula phenolica]|uniref:histidine kinase n=1 Tax=Desulfobacula phenolica TaxID=90732 RepID=A0A1H2DU53_9BACT|nr:ATP-binding protein [Desulfobacula phenolica]SDT86389.1 Signal transduction histidine kinase [Desulfobacula phenolica]
MAKQILIIDRDAGHAGALKIYTERLQYEVTIATTFEQVGFELDNNIFDIILADLFSFDELLPCLESIKKKYPIVQILIFAAKDKLDDAMDIFGSKATNYLDLPVNSKALDLALITACKNISTDRKIIRYSERLGDLRHAQELLNQLFDEVPCYISVQDRNLRITAANNRFKHHFGSQVGGFCYELYKHRTSQCPDCPVVETFQDGKCHHTEEIVTSKFGKQYNVLTQTAPIRNEQGEITQVMEMSTNITQIRQLQNHLISLGLMLGSMSHGVKGMLTALDGGLYQLETGLAQKDDDRISKAFGLIQQMSDKIKKMVLEILYYAKSRELQYEDMDVALLAGNVINTIRPLAENYAVKLDVCIPESLGKIEVDAAWMEAALVNFLENAVDACVFDRDKKEHCIQFHVGKTSDEFIVFTISDNGIGMDTETKNKMFTLFFTSKGSQGTGLGLFIANRVIKYHGGTVEVESEQGRGTKFIILLPLQKPDNAKIVEFPRTTR